MIHLAIILIIVGAIVFLVRRANFIDDFFKTLIYVIAVVFALIYVLQHLSVLGVR